MKHVWLATAFILLMTAAAFAQDQPQAQQGQDQPQLLGRGRGGAPFAWNDRDKDGICDITGQPVGQRPIGFGGGRGRGWWAATGQGTAQGAVYGRGRGGAPFAWNDRNRDGICDLTGRPVGYGGGRGRAGGYAWRDRDGDGICDFTGVPVRTGRGRGWWNQAPQPQPKP
jgi:hypothetical protein